MNDLQVALSLGERLAAQGHRVAWRLIVDRTSDVGEAFGISLAEREGYVAAALATLMGGNVT